MVEDVSRPVQSSNALGLTVGGMADESMMLVVARHANVVSTEKTKSMILLQKIMYIRFYRV